MGKEFTIVMYNRWWQAVGVRKTTQKTTVASSTGTSTSFSDSYGVNTGSSVGTKYERTTSTNQGYNYTYDYSHSYGINIRFFDIPDITIKPEAANTIFSGYAEIDFDAAWDGHVYMYKGVLTEELPAGAEAAYNAVYNAAWSTTVASNRFSVTIDDANVESALKYGVVFLPKHPVSPSSSAWTVGTHLITPISADVKLCIRNPAARGVVSALSPGQYSTIVRSRETEITYQYDQDYGRYAQGWLAVRAVNLDTQETVTVVPKTAVTVEDGERGSFTIPAGVLGEGRWNLTICAAPAAASDYFADDDEFWGEGQSFQFIVRENPSTSSVSCDGRPIPVVSWHSSTQAAYQVRFGDYDSGARAGQETSFTVPRIFADGSYAMQVRTASEAGEWSAWSETVWTEIRNVPPEGYVALTAETEGPVVRLSWEERTPVDTYLQDSAGQYVLDSGGSRIETTSWIATADNYAVMRDGVLVAVTDTEAWADRAGAGVYQIYAVYDRYYIASNIEEAVPHPASDMLSSDGGYTWLRLRFTPERKVQPEGVRTEITYTYYAGRSKPVAFSTGQRQRVKSFDYLFRGRDRSEAQRLRALEGSEVILKTTRGEFIRGIIGEMMWTDARNPQVSFQIREVEGEEDRIEYPA